MNILAALFGIFRQRGLVSTIKEGRSLAGFTLFAILLSIIGGVLYGFAMGVGLGIDTAVKDAIKVGLIITLGLLLSTPIFWVAYRLMGREERPAQVAAVPLTLVATVAIILAITAPIVFLLSVLVGFSPEAVYIHIVIVDLALLVGLYLAGTLVYHGFSDHKRLIVPNVVGFLMMGVILVVLMSFLGPFLSPRSTFSVGTDRLKDRLAIGVAEKANQALAAATSADRLRYRFQTTNDNGDLTRDYTVTRVGDDYLIEVHLHRVSSRAVPGDTLSNRRDQQRIWVLDGQYYTDFDEGAGGYPAGGYPKVTRGTYADLASFLGPALPPAVFTLPPEFAAASWRAEESDGRYTARGTTQGTRPNATEATLVLDAATGRLSDLTLGSAERDLHAEVRVSDIVPATLDRIALETTLNQAIVVGSVDRSDASLQDYVQDEAFFVVRYPRRNWWAGRWDAAQQRVKFTNDCGAAGGCPALAVSVYDLTEGKGPGQYAEDLGRSLGLQPEYRKIKVSTTTIGYPPAGDQTVGAGGYPVVEYLFDRMVRGKVETTHHIEYIFVGQLSRYHLDFTAPPNQFEANRDSFEAIAAGFTYLR